MGLREDDSATNVEPFTPAKRALLTRGADPEEFLAAWRFGDWNDFRIRCVGPIPTVTAWINGLLVAEIDLAVRRARHYDPAAVAALLGTRGQIALKVHDTDPLLGPERWGHDTRRRRRNIRIREL